MAKNLRLAEVAFAIAGVVLFGASWGMSFWLWKEMPTQPDAAQGFTFPMIIHGRTIYLSSAYNLFYHALFWGGLVLFFCAVLIDAYKDPFNWRTMRR